MVLASGLLAGFWLVPQAVRSFSVAAQQTGSALSEVLPGEEEQARRTLDGSAAQVGERARSCSAHLAVVSARAQPGQEASLRIRSGNYVTPVFKLTDAPVRIALPFPAPYEVGTGTLMIFKDGGDAVIALLPEVRVTNAQNPAIRQVHWRTDEACRRGAG
jgi:hypothetical protein